MNEKEFIQDLKKHNVEIDEKQLSLFKQYYEILVEYNQKMNLTSITDKDEVYLKHFYDSLSLLFYCSIEENFKLCDVGAGAGFPSIPLKIVRPDLKITIVDSLGKRIQFLNHLIKKLDLNEVNMVHSRAEEFSVNNRESYDIVTGRAVARLNILSELCVPLVRENGKFIAMKGQTGHEELQEAKNAIKTLGCELKAVHEFSLPLNGGSRNILIFTKKHKTPNKYPRNYSQIKNKPL
ncbi:16S rRNA (guanine(527)-N(7))-methyltransferase RsmG [Mycoplasmatota bacterium]|nr:16S rRNA (guanine(527)-N(7))-methyltransferase RsmG [Mycoplasmatota bacterium]